MKSICLQTFLYLFISSFCFAQKEASNWYFGYHTGLDFSTNPPTLLTQSASNSTGGMAAISDSTGNLLFYTDGVTVWNALHKRMPNGAGLKGHQGIAQSSVIITTGIGARKKYYIFTSDGSSGNPEYPNDSVFAYSIVDMAANNGQGDVTTKNKILLSGVNESVAAVKHANGIDTWVLTHKLHTDEFYAYLISNCGISTPVISHSGPIEKDNYQAYLKFSPNGKKISYVFALVYYPIQYVFDFDPSSGVVKNPISLGDLSASNSCSFSPNSRYLYTSGATLISGTPTQTSLNQYDLLATDIPASVQTIPAAPLGAMQLGIDGKLYILDVGDGHLNPLASNPQIDVLSNPNNPLSQADYQHGAYNIAHDGFVYGLPNFIESYFMPGYHDSIPVYPSFNANRVCEGDSTSFNISNSSGQSFNWDFGNPLSGSENYSTIINPRHKYSQAGNYTVLCRSNNSICADTITKIIVVDSLPFVSLGNDINQTACNKQPIVLNAGKGYLSYLWQDGSTEQIFTTNDKGSYHVKVTNACGNYTASIDIQKSDYKIPNLITPNNDNKNDRFEINTLGEKGNLSIWNSWGNEVYKNTFYDNSWDASNVEAGVYYFSFQLADCLVNTGWIEVIK